MRDIEQRCSIEVMIWLCLWENCIGEGTVRTVFPFTRGMSRLRFVLQRDLEKLTASQNVHDVAIFRFYARSLSMAKWYDSYIQYCT